MATQDDCRKKAAVFLRMASEVTEPWVKNLLRLAAADCLADAQQAEPAPVVQQQQQIPPDRDGSP
jgi:hypothetical protein